jgi:hypothetical protein
VDQSAARLDLRRRGAGAGVDAVGRSRVVAPPAASAVETLYVIVDGLQHAG